MNSNIDEELTKTFNLIENRYVHGKGFACKCRRCKKLFWYFTPDKQSCSYIECMSERYHKREQNSWKKVYNKPSYYKEDSDANGGWSNGISNFENNQ